MRLEQLKQFLEVAKTGSIRSAAENLYITSPALSSAIQSLEKEVGFPLFERQHSGVTLTPYGKTMVKTAKQILEDSKQFQWIRAEYENSLHKNLQGNFTVSLVVAANSFYMHNIIPLFSEIYPKMNLIVMEQASQFVQQNVLSAKSDLGILFGTPSLQDMFKDNPLYAEFEIQALYDEKLYAMIGPASPLHMHKTVTLTEISKFPLALTASTVEDTSVQEELFAKYPNVQVSLRTNSLNLIQQHILKNNVIGLAFSSSFELYSDDLTCIPIIPDTYLTIYAIYRKDSPKLHVIQTFLQIIEQFRDF